MAAAASGAGGSSITPENEFNNLFERMYQICEENKWGDPFSYARSREIHLANFLGHRVAKTLSGADAIDSDGECEYKTTICENIKATYNGISVQPTWEEQLTYLREQKIGKYQNHYFARYDGGKIVEVWKMKSEKVLEFLIPKLKRQYEKENKGKDPRLGSQIPSSYIRKHAERIK